MFYVECVLYDVAAEVVERMQAGAYTPQPKPKTTLNLKPQAKPQLKPQPKPQPKPQLQPPRSCNSLFL